MRSGTIAYVLGVCLLLTQRELPDPSSLEFLPLALAVALAHRGCRAVALGVAGFLAAALSAQLALQQPFPSPLEGKTVLLEGVVATLPRHDERRLGFELEVEALRADGAAVPWRGRVRLSWYEEHPSVEVDSRWRLAARLKAPHGFMNPGGFDYEAWLFREGIRATGYVRDDPRNAHLGDARRFPVAKVRERLRERLGEALAEERLAGVVNALAIGYRGDISAAQWEVFRETGTAHLMAISGLHIGLVAGFVFVLARHAWSCLPFAVSAMAAPRAASLFAAAGALVYALMSGFAVPAQRALIMLAAIMLSLLLARRPAASVSLCAALGAVVLLDPFAVLSPGFWLSFGAVAVILLGMMGYRGRAARGPRAWWWRWGRVQWCVTLGLAPLVLGLFGEWPAIAPIANVVAVPWVGMVVVPLVLVGTLLSALEPGAGAFVLRLGADALGLLWPFLELLSNAGPSLPLPGAIEPWVAGAAALAVVLLLLPAGTPGRWLGAPLLLPLGLGTVPEVPAGAVELTLLDVGQGLAAVVRTRRHVLVYDAGPRYGEDFDASNAVILPYLRERGVRTVDLLVLSHAHEDHVGGAGRLLRDGDVRRVLSNVSAAAERASPCLRGAKWAWDGVEMEVLAPDALGAGASENDRSCVLRIESGEHSLLLPGDIEREAEARLVAEQGAALETDIVVVPHHGSRTSSSAPFVAATRPRYALFSTGYRNRHRFPHPEVRARYERAGAVVLDTAEAGAIRFELVPGAPIAAPVLYRHAARRIWTHRVPPDTIAE